MSIFTFLVRGGPEKIRSRVTKHNHSLRSDSAKYSRPRLADPEGPPATSFESSRNLLPAGCFWSTNKKAILPDGLFFILVDLTLIDWHEISLEYIEFASTAKDFYYYLKIPESFHYPLTGTNNTALYSDNAAKAKYQQSSDALEVPLVLLV